MPSAGLQSDQVKLRAGPTDSQSCTAHEERTYAPPERRSATQVSRSRNGTRSPVVGKRSSCGGFKTGVNGATTPQGSAPCPHQKRA